MLTAVAIILAVMIVFFFIGQPVLHAPSAKFVGIKNVAGQTNVATFTITNPYNRTVQFVVASPQQSVDGIWNPATVEIPPSYVVHTLPPGATTNFTANFPTNSGTWRAPFLWGVSFTGLEHIRFFGEHNWRHYKEHGTLLGWRIAYGTSLLTNFTPVISMGSSEPSATNAMDQERSMLPR